MRVASIVVLVLALTQGLGLSALLAPEQAPPLPQWSRGTPERFVLSGPVTTLDLASYYGPVTVEPGRGRVLQVELTKLTRVGLDKAAAERAAKVRLKPELRAGVLSLCTYGPEGEGGWMEVVDYEVRLLTPASWHADASAGSGAPPLVRIKSRDGAVRLHRLRGRQEVNAISGAVELEGLRGTAEIGTVEGAVTGVDLDWNRATVRSSGGNITVGLRALSAQADLQLSSAIGNLKITLPKGASCHVEADTTAGKVVTDLTELKPGLRYGGRSLRGTLGKGEARVKLQSTSGRIEITETAPPRD